MSFQDNFEEFLTKVGAAIKDATELEVITVRGTAQIKLKDDGAGGKKTINFDSFFQNGELSGDLHVVSATRIEVDGDTFLYIEDDAPQGMREAHLEATKAAQEYRQGLIEGVLSIFRAV